MILFKKRGSRCFPAVIRQLAGKIQVQPIRPSDGNLRPLFSPVQDEFAQVAGKSRLQGKNAGKLARKLLPWMTRK